MGSASNPLSHALPPLGPAGGAPPPPLGGTPMLDLSLKRDPTKQEVKASPFSAEALLSRPSPKPQVGTDKSTGWSIWSDSRLGWLRFGREGGPGHVGCYTSYHMP